MCTGVSVSTGNSYQAEALTNVLRHHTCRSSHPEDRKLSITELKWDASNLTDIPGNTAHWLYKKYYLCVHPLPVPMSTRITKYLNKYVRRSLCLIYISSFYFWNPPLARKIYIYKAETCTNILRYNTCMSSYPGDRKWTKIEP
jgi:hypothetical protein